LNVDPFKVVNILGFNSVSELIYIASQMLTIFPLAGMVYFFARLYLGWSNIGWYLYFKLV
jgi:hypothetical protein